jgi:FkbM family methyltransferase
MGFISYAQNAEDVLLNRVFGAIDSGFYIDVGAAHPVSHSVTKAFYLRGWRGVNIEPLSQFFTALEADRPGDVNLQIGLSNRAGFARFYEVPWCTGWSTFDPETIKRYRIEGKSVIEHTVQVMTLAHVCEHYAPQTIHFLKVDVEGHEQAVLEGANFTRWRPIVVLVEATVQGTTTPNHQGWEPILLDNDYQFAHFDGLNRYYVRAEDAAAILPRLSYPVCAFDEFERAEHLQALQQAKAEHSEALQQVRRELDALRCQVQSTHDELIRTQAELRKIQGQNRFYRDVLAVTREQLEAAQSDFYKRFMGPTALSS